MNASPTTAASGDAVITAKGLRKAYKTTVALDMPASAFRAGASSA